MTPTTGDGTPAAKRLAARWVWCCHRAPRPWNSFVYFRRVVDLPSKPTHADARVSADSRYLLYVNGVRAHEGPARSHRGTRGLDFLDLAELLKPGRNVIAVIAAQVGVETSLGPAGVASGFLFDCLAECEGQTLDLHTPGQWMFREARGWRKDSARLAADLAFQEHFDAGEDPLDWMSADYVADEAGGWRTPVDIGPAGGHPWPKLEARATPLLGAIPDRFTAVGAQFTGENARGYKIAEDLVRLAASEPRKKAKGAVENAQALLQDDAGLCLVMPGEPGNFVMLVLDAGRMATARLALDIADAAGDEIIDVLYADALDKSGAPQLPPAESDEALADRYRCRAGAQQWSAFWPKGFRYAALVFRNLTRPLKLRHAGFQRIGAVLPSSASFECSDKALNDIWRVSRNTLVACALDVHVDDPRRRMALWLGDLPQRLRCVSHALGDVTMFEQALRLGAQSQACDGSLHAYPPGEFARGRDVAGMLAWISGLQEYRMHTGRSGLLRQGAQTLLRLLEFFQGHEDADGLLAPADGFGSSSDLAEMPPRSNATVLNLLYLRALRQSAEMLDAIDMAEPAAAERIRARASELATTVARVLFDPKSGLWRDTRDLAADPSSQYANALAVLLGLLPETHAAIADAALVKASLSKRGKVVQATPFSFASVLDALDALGRGGDILTLLRERHGKLIAEGAATFGPTFEPKPGDCICHGACACPAYVLPQQVLGVKMAGPGWASVRIAPLLDGLDFARGVVPTPLGLLRVDWEKAGEDQLVAHVDIPAGMKAEFVDPLGKSRALAEGMNEFHT